MILKVRNKELILPAFFPDATHGCIKCVGTQDLFENEINTLVVNTYHLIKDDKIDLIKKSDGIHSFMHFDGIVISDSGGFQVMSLIRQNPKNGKITDEEIEFKLESDNKKLILTPESCIKTQIDMGTDIIMCLDDCTNPDEPLQEQELSVERTIFWAEKCKSSYLEQTANIQQKPLLFGIIQGGISKRLRKKCAHALIKIGFDGFAYGGWPVNSDGMFLTDIVGYTASLMPDDLPKYAMGVGKPENILDCIALGYNMFDCVLPTRDARHKRLYVFDKRESTGYHFIYLQSGKYKEDLNPIDDTCSCTTCKNYTKAYLWHLFRIKDPTAMRLATIHNLKFYQDLMEMLVTTGIGS